MIGSKIIHEGPQTGVLFYWIGWLWMKLFGWDVKGQLPPGGKYVLIAAPHTSNWDLPFLIASGFVFRLKISWLGKETIFKKPFGGIMRFLGGIAVDRKNKHGLVKQIADKFNEFKKLVVVVPPSGTRKKNDHWKSGFYWVAHSARTPVICSYLDYERKEAGIAYSFLPSDNIISDMDGVREFYKDIKGKYPELTSTIRLKDEDKTG